MKLVCPHCAKVIEIADSLAGQTTSCSLCQGPLTVPFAPSAAAPTPPQASPTPAPVSPSPLPPPPPPPPAPDPLGTTTAWTPSASSTGGSVIPPVHTPSGNGGNGGIWQQRLDTFHIPPYVHEWIGLAALALLFFLFLFPWVGVYVGSTPLAVQSGVGIGFGTTTHMEEAKSLVTQLPGSTMVVLAFLCSLLGLIFLGLILVEKFASTPAIEKLKPTLDRLKVLQDVIVLSLLGVIFLVLVLHYVVLSFPLESAAWSEKASDTMLLGLKLKTEGITAVKEKAYGMVGMQWLERRGYFSLALLISLIATAWCGIRFLHTRGVTRTWPRLAIVWSQQAPQLTAESPMKFSDLTKPG